MEVFVGDLVLNHLWRYNGCKEVGVVVWAPSYSETRPNLVDVMWNDGSIRKVWTDELEVAP